MLRFSSRLIFAGVLLAGCLVCLIGAKAQTWREIGKMPSRPTCSYFWDTAHGVVGGWQFVSVYSDGNWTSSNWSPFNGIVHAIRRLDNENLYAASETGVWKSADSGQTWIKTITNEPAEEVYMSKGGQIFAPSMQEGSTFARLDSNICALAQDDKLGLIAAPQYSTDGGKDWHSSICFNEGFAGGYSVVADTCRKLFWAAPETLLLNPQDVTPQVSTDSGKTWRDRKFSWYSNDSWAHDIADGEDGIIYSQSDSVYRSSDDGISWQSMGGPGVINDWEDRRIF
ncbi:MAG TPA: hypothetical protein VFX22_01835, partial [Candidatus Kapabacteria bacterium]|nr:hypothetical protein [Candidatus Kapabacteria bacterium]